MKLIQNVLVVCLLTLGCARGPAGVLASPPGKASADENLLRFPEVFTNVIGPRCATCHSEAGGNRGGVNLETFEAVKSNLSLVQDSVAAGWMPPRSRPPLSVQEKDLVLRWIDQGALP